MKTAASAAPVPICDALAGILEAWLAVRLDPPTMPPAAEVPFLWPGTYGRCPYRDGGPGISPLDVLKDAGTLRRRRRRHLAGPQAESRDRPRGSRRPTGDDRSRAQAQRGSLEAVLPASGSRHDPRRRLGAGVLTMPSYDRIHWIRWLAREGIPPGHVMRVLDCDDADVAEALRGSMGARSGR